MKKLAISLALVVAVTTGVLIYEDGAVIDPPPRPYKFITLAWEDPSPPEAQVIGYRLYMGEQSGAYAGSVRMPLLQHLRGLCEVPVLINHPVTYFAVAAYNATEEGPPSDELRYEYPAMQEWINLQSPISNLQSRP